MFEKIIVLDAKGHLLGRAAARVAKEILQGQKVVVVRCEEMNKSGSLYRNKVIYLRFLNKRTNSNPSRGPFHHRSPAMIFWRAVRGMVPHKITKGKLAMARLKVFEGIPHPYDKMNRVVMPKALKYIQMKPHRKFCRLGDLSTAVGWKHGDLLKRLEAKRIVKTQTRYKQHKIKKDLQNNARKYLHYNNARFRWLNSELKKYKIGAEYKVPAKKKTKNKFLIRKFGLEKKWDVRACKRWCRSRNMKYTPGLEKKHYHDWNPNVHSEKAIAQKAKDDAKKAE